MKFFGRESRRQIATALSFSLFFSPLLTMASTTEINKKQGLSVATALVSASLLKKHTRAPRFPQTTYQQPLPSPQTSLFPPLPQDIFVAGDIVVGGFLNVSQNGIRLFEDPANGTNSVTLKAAASMPMDYTLRFPGSAPVGDQYLAADANGNMFWASGSGGVGNIIDGGNSFGHDIAIGSNDNFGMSFKTNNTNRLTLANNGAITANGLTGVSDRYVTASSSGLLTATMPTGVKNVIQVINDIPVVEGKYYNTLKDAVDWANANATGITVISIAGGTHVVNDTIEITNPLIRGISGVSTGGTVLIPGLSLAGTPLFMLSQDAGSDVFTVQDLSIDGFAEPAYISTPGSVGIRITGTASFGLVNVLAQGCFRNIEIDGENDITLLQTVVLNSCVLLGAGDCSLLLDNGAYASANNLIAYGAGNNLVRVQCTNAASPMTELTLVAGWLTDIVPGTADGILARDNSYVLIQSSRIYDVQNGVVAEGLGQIKSMGNVRIKGEITHYKQVDGSAKIQVIGDFVDGSQNSQFLIVNPNNVYFDILDITTNMRKSGRLVDESYLIDAVLTGHEDKDPVYQYVSNWFGFKGDGIELSEEVLSGSTGVTGISAWNSSAYNSSLIRGLQAHTKDAGLILATYASDGDPRTPDYSKARSWRLIKRANDHAFTMIHFNGAAYSMPLILTATGNLGLGASAPVSRLELGSGQISVPAGDAVFPSYSFTGDLNTGIFSPASNSVALTTDGLARLIVDAAGSVTVSGLGLGIVHSSVAGLLTSSPIVNSDIADGSIANAKLATPVTSNNTSSSIVMRDASGNFSAGTITASLNGNATTATSAGSFSGVLSGQVTGPQNLTVVAAVDGKTAAEVGSAVTDVQNATPNATLSTLVKRDASGNFGAGTITATLLGNVMGDVSGSAANFTGNLLGDVTGTQVATVVSAVGGVSALNVASGANAANAATNANTASTIVKRDGSGNFHAGTITASLTGAASLNVLKAGDTMTGPLVMANQQPIRLSQFGGSNYAALQAPAALVSSYTLTMPATAGTNNQVLSSDGLGGLLWQDTGTAGGYFLNGGNSFTGNASLGTNDSFSLTLKTGGVNRLTFAASGAINIPAFAGSGERYISTDTVGTLAGVLPVGTKNVLYVVKDHPVVAGKYYATIKDAVDWANANASEPTTIWIESGYFPVTSTIEITNPMIRAIRGESVGGSIVVPDVALVGLPVFHLSANYGFDTFSIQDLSIDGSGTLGYRTTPGGVGLLVTGVANFGMLNLLTQGCYRGFEIDGDPAFPGGQISVLTSCYALLSGDCGVLVDNGAFVTATELVAAWSGNQEVRVQRTNAAAPMTEFTIVASWLTDDVAGTGDGLLAKDVSKVLLESSRVYDVQNAIVAEGNALVASLGNLRLAGVVDNYKQIDGTAVIQASGDLVEDAAVSKFLITDANNVYFDIIDRAGNVRKIGNMTNDNVSVFSILTGSGAGDPWYGYQKDWFGYRGELFEMPEAAMVGSSGNAGRALCTVNNDALLVSFVRGLQAHDKEAGLLLGTYASDGDPATPDYSLSRAWQLYKNPFGNGTLSFSSFNGAVWQTPFSLTMDGKLGLGSEIPSTRLEVGSGQVSAPSGNAVAPTYTFLFNLNTGLYSPGLGAVALSSNGLASLIAQASGVITIPNLAPTAGVVHNDASGNLSSSLIMNGDVSASAAISDTKLATIATAEKVANSATTATSTNTASAIVARDGSGNFTATMITSNLTGTVTGNVSGTAAGFTGSLSGDVTGTQGATHVAFVDGQSAVNVSAATIAANAATSSNTVSTIVKRDASGNFSAGTVSATNFSGPLTGNVTGNVSGSAASFTGSLLGDVTGTQSATVVSAVGGVSAVNIASGANAANAATSLNTASTIVKRDGSGNFIAGTITAALTGAASANVLKAGDTMTGTLTMGNRQQVRFSEATPGTNYVALQAPSPLGSSYTLTLPSSAGTNGYVLATDGSGTLSWQPSGSAAGYFVNGGNNFGGVGPAVLGTTAAAGYGLNLISNGNQAISLSTTGTVLIPSLVGTGDRVVQADATGTLGATLPTGTKNIVYVVKDIPTVVGKYYPTLKAAVDWANANAVEQTAVVVAPGSHVITATVAVTNPLVTAIIGQGVAATRLVVDPALVGSPVLTLSQTTDAFSLQDLVIDATVVPAFMTTPGSIGIYISGSAYYDLNSLLIQGCYQGMFVDGLTALPYETVALMNSFILLSGDCGILVDNGGYIFGNNVTVSYAGNQDIRAQSTNIGAQRTQVSLTASWISGDPIAGTGDGILVKDTAYALISSSRVYYVQNAFVVDGSAELNTVGNPRVEGIVTHYKQVAGTAQMEALGDVVTGATPDKFSVADSDQVYFDGFDTVAERRYSGRMANTTYDLSKILTGNGVNDPVTRYVQNWFGFTGQGIELSEAVLGGLSGAQTVVTHNNNCYTSSFIRGLSAHAYTAGLVLGTYASDGDPATPDWSLARSWRIEKRPTDHAFELKRWNGSTYLTPLVVTSTGNLGLDSTGVLTNPVSQLELGSGQISVPAGNAPAPSYSFTGDLNTGLFSTGADAVALSTNGLARLRVGSTGTITIPTFITAGIVHNDASGNLSSSLITNGDISGTAAIADTKLAPIVTAGKVSNTATTATVTNTPDTIVLRDLVTGNFSAGTITASLTGAASDNVLKAGDTMTGNLTMSNQKQVRFAEQNPGINYAALQAPASVTSSYTLTLPLTSGTSGYVLTTDGANPATLSWSPIGTAAGYFVNGGNSFGAAATVGTNDSFDLNIETNNITRMQISGVTGDISIPAFTTAGVLHNALATGNLSSSLIKNADVDPAAGIIDTKLATIATVGKVLNTATSATVANTPDTIVLRDLVTGNFSAGTITATFSGNLTGSVTGAASLNVLKSGDTMTGALALSGGSSNLTVGGTSYLQAAQTAGLLSVNNGVYYLNGVPCLAQNVLQVTKGTISGPNQFNSVKAAVDSIVGNTATNPFVVQVGPGLFIEDTITLKEYVSLIGESPIATIIQVNATSKDVIIGAPHAFISDLGIDGASDSDKAGIRFHGGGMLNLARVAFYGCNIGLYEDATIAPYAFVLVGDSSFGSTSLFKTGIKLDGSGVLPVYMKVNGLTWLAQSNASFQTMLDIAGAQTVFVSSSIDVGSAGFFGGVGCLISDGASFGMQSSSLHGFTTGISVPNVGVAPSLNIISVYGQVNTTDVSIVKAGTTGTINGVFAQNRVVIDPGASLSVFLTDPENDGTVTVGPMFLGATYPQITNVSNQIEHGANLGLLSGGVFDEAIGVLQADIALGDGYAMVGTAPNDYLKYVEWVDQAVTLTANADNFLFIDNAGIAHASTSEPDPTTTILLGKMRTNATGEVFCERMAESMEHTASELDYSWREALGPVYASGSLVSKNGTVQLDVTQGRYFYGTIEYNPSAGTAVSWKAFYTSGASGNYVAVDQSNVDYAQYNYYDGGSGLWSLAAIPGDKFARHSFYVVNDGVNQYYLLVYGQTVYNTLLDAQNGSIPPAPATWTGNMALIASLIVKNDLTTPANYISEIRDERPRLGFKASGVSVITVHGDLQGLGADDHLQYVRTDGTRVMTGSLNLGTNSITNVNLVDGVDVSAHASRHQPGGADPLLVAAPVTISTANSEGLLTTLARSDHVHAHGNLVGGTLHAVATANPGGTAGFMSAADKTLLDSINPALYVQKAGDTMAGTLAFNATGLNALVVNTNKFIVDNDTGNTTIAGILGVTGATTLTNLASVDSGIVHASATGLLSKSYIVNDDVDPSAGIVDSKLATIATAGKVSNSATTATIANTPDTIVLRDLVTGNFAAGTISAVGLDVSGKTITLNKGGILGSGTLSGIQIEEAGTPAAGYFRTGAGGNSWQLKAPASVGEVVITPGAGGFTIDQGSHNPVTIGVTPNGLSLATQVLSLALSGAGSTGALSSSDWNLFNGKQSGSATLTALSSYNTNGLMTQTAPNTFTGRTIVGASVNQVLVADGNGVGGNPTLSLPQNIHTGATPTFAGMTLAATPQAQLRLQEDSGNGALYVALQAPALVTPASYTLTLPAAVGSINQVLAATDGAGTLGWVTGLPGYVLMGGNTADGLMSIGTIDNYGLTLKTNNADRLQISNTGTVTIPNLSTAGIVHNAAGGLLSTSLIFNADIAPGAAIADTKLAIISTAGKVANGATSAISAPANPDTIVLRDGSGNFTANVITASLSGNVTGSATSFSGPLVGDVNGNQGATVVAKVGGVLAASVASGANAANAATSLNTASTIVLRDGSGNFSAGTITASLTGHASLDLPLTGGILSGSLTMNNVPIVLQNGLGNTVTVQVPAAGLSNYALTLPTTSGTSGYVLTTDGANPATLTWQPTGAGAGYFVNGGNAFGGGTTTLGTLDSNNLNIVTGIAGPNTRISISNSGTIAIPAFTAAGVVHNAVTTGNLSSSLIVNADITVGTIGNDKLATLTTSGLIDNSATTATSANTASAIVARDASGNFNASTILLENQGQLQLQQPTAGGSNTVNLRAPATLTGGSYTLTLPLETGATGYTLVTDGSGNLGWSAFAPAGSYFMQGGNNFGAAAVLGTTDSNALNLVTGGASNNRLTISSTGTIAIPAFTAAGIVHNAITSGNLSSSLIVNDDVDPGAAIVDTKLATIATAGKVWNSATTATNLNTASAIVARDVSGIFNIGSVFFENQGQVRLGEATGNGLNYVALRAPPSVISNYTLTLPDAVGSINQVLVATDGAGTLGWVTGLPGYVLMGGNTADSLMSIGTIDNYGLTLKTNNADRLQISNAGTVTIPNLSTAGIVHNTAGGLLSTSLIFNADIAPGAAIVDTKLAIISTAGKVANGATSAISAPANPDTIVLRDGSGNFTANVITASLSGNVTGSATSFSGPLVGDVNGNQGATVVAKVGGVLAASVASGANAANAATSLNTASTIVLRDGSGNFSAGTITASLTGHASLDLPLTGGILSGSLTMNNVPIVLQNGLGNTVTVQVPAAGLSNYALTLPTTSGTSGYVLTTDGANPATLTWQPTGAGAGYFVNGGNAFGGGTTTLGTLDSNNLNIVTGIAGPNTRISISNSGTIAIPAFTAAGVVHNAVTTGNLSSSLIVNADITVGTIGNDKLATLTTSGLIDNSATTATSANTASAIVARDASGNFNASTILLENQGQLQLQQPTAGGSNTVNLRAPATLTGGSYTLTLPLETGATGYTLVTDGSGNLGWSAFAPAGSYFMQGGNNFGAAAVLGTTDSNALNLVTGGASNNRLTISSTGTIAIPAFTAAGIVHNAITSGNLSSSLIVNDDVDPGAAIVDTKLATIATAGKVWNSATTATNLNTASAIVARDVSGIFNIGSVFFENQGQVRLGEATGNGLNYVALRAPPSVISNYTLTLPDAVGSINQVLVATDGAGTLGWVTGLPGYVLMGGNTADSLMSIGTIDNYGLTLKTNNADRLQISNAGTVTIPNLSTAGIVHNTAGGLLSTSLIFNADIAPGAAIVDTKLAIISTAGKVANGATSAISAPANPDTIVLRDGSGNFTANVITASLSGNVTGSATSFSGPLVGDVNGNQGATVVAKVGGVLAASVASGANAANAATSLNTASTIVLRDGSGNFSAGTITASLTGHASLDLPLTGGILSGSLTMNNVPIVLQNGLGNTVTVQVPAAGLSNYALTLPTTSGTSGYVLTTDGANPATLTWQPTGAGAGYFVNGGNAFGGGTTTLGTLDSNNLNIVTGIAGPNTRISISNSGTIAIPAFTAAGVVHNAVTTGNLSSSLIVNADITVGTIGNDKLATLTTSGLIDNSATTATSANTASAIVARDASGNFNASTILLENQGQLQLQQPTAGGSNTVNLRAPATLTGGSYTLTLPLETGATGYTLVTDGSGNLGWSAFAPAGSYFMQGGNNFGAAAVLGTTDSNALNLVTGGASNNRLTISSTGTIAIPAFTAAGIVHNAITSGNLSSSLIVNDDVDPGAAIVDTKLATIATAGKVWNSATTATNLNTASAIVARDVSGIFNIGSVFFENQGQVRLGEATGNGLNYVALRAPPSVISNYTLTLPDAVGSINQVLVATDGAGTLGWVTGLPGYVLMGGNTADSLMSIGTIDNYGLTLKTNNADRLQISNAGTVTIPNLSTAGIVHNTAGGLLSTSLIFNADIAPGAAIVDTKLAIISTAGKVANGATSAISAPANPDTIVLRDGSGNFTANVITASLSGNVTGNVTGSASLNVLKTGDTMTGPLTMNSQQQIRLRDLANANSASLSAPDSLGSSYVLKLPTSSGTAGYALTTDGANPALLSWAPIGTAAGYFINGGNSFGSTASLGTNDINNLLLKTNNTTRMIIDSVGKFGIGQATVDANYTLAATGDLLVQNGSGTSTLIGLTKGTTQWALAAETAGSTNTFSVRNVAGGLPGTARMTIDNTGVTNKTTFYTDMQVSTLNVVGVVHTDASGNFSTSTVTNDDIAPAAGILDSKLATISTAGKVFNSATTATSANTASAIVARDVSGNFSAGTITASLTGHASLDLPLTGGTLTGALAINAGAGNALVVNTNKFIVDNTTGNTTIAGTLGATGATTLSSLGTGVVHSSGAGLLSSSLIVNDDVDPAAAIVDTKLATIATAGKVWNSATTATSLNTASAIVARDLSGNFSAGTITASLTGHASLDLPLTGGALSGSLTMSNVPLILANGSANTVSLAAPATLTNYTFTFPTTAGTNGYALTTNGSGTLSWANLAPAGNYFINGGNSFIGTASLGTNDGYDLNFKTNNLTRMQISSAGTIAIPAFSAAGIVHNAVTTGNLSSSLIVNGDIHPSAAIEDTKLATIATAGKVSNSATTATTSNALDTIVLRDAITGNFSAGTISATFSGNLTGSVTGAASANVLKAGDTMTGNLIMSNQQQVRLSELTVNGNNYIALRAPASVTADTVLTLPDGAGTNGYALTTNGSGTLSWTNLAPAGNYFAQGGNAFTATAVLGTTDAFGLNLVTGGAGNNRLTISSTGTIAIPAFATAGIVHNNASGQLSSSLISNADLATVASANTPSYLVLRDASGNFSAGVVSCETSLKLKDSGSANTVTMQAPTLASAYTLTLPTSVGTSGYVLTTDGANPALLSWQPSGAAANAFVNGGNSFGGVASLGTNDPNNLLFKTNNATRMTLSSSGETLFTDKLLTINHGGAVSSGSGAGLEIEENSIITGSAKTSSDRVSWEFTAPAQSYKAILSPRGASFTGLTVGSSNFFMGANVGNATVTGTQNVGVGHTAMTLCSSGYNQTALGYGALNAATTTYDNTAIGCGALATTTVQGNTAVGAFALNAVTNAGYNTAVGAWALRYSVSGWNNIGIGYLAGQNFGTYDSGNIVIGNQGVNGDNNVIRLGTSGTHTSCYLAGINGVTVTGGVPVYMNSSGQLGTGTSLGAAFVNGGNSFGTVATLGTNDANNLLFRTNNTDRMIIDSTGKVAIGQSTVDPNFGIRLNSDTLLAGAGLSGNTYIGMQQGTSIWGLEVDTTGGINTFTIRDATTSGLLGNVRVEIDTAGNTTTSTNYKMAAYRATSNQVIGATTGIVIFNTELFDPGADYNAATGRYTAPYTGYYLVAPNVSVLATTTAGNRTMALYRGGVAIPGYAVRNYFVVGAGRNFLMSATWLLYMAAGDIIDVRLTGLHTADAVVFDYSSLNIHFMSFTPV